MNMLEAVANWYGCPYGLKKCGKTRNKCGNYLMLDPRPDWDKGVGPGPKGQRTLCNLLEDLDRQIMRKTNDRRLEE